MLLPASPTDDLAYDHDGNLTLSTGQGLAYQWDYRNRLRQVCKLTGTATNCSSPGATVIATYSYDAMNRRTRKVVANSGSLNGTTNFYYDAWRTIEERDNSNTLTQQYVYGIYQDEPVVFDRGSGPRLFYHQNTLYSPSALTGTSGNVVEGYQYDAYGQQTVLGPDFMTVLGTTSTVGNPYMYTGQRFDPETGLYYYKKRYYSASLGRFISHDPLEYIDGMNLYEYAMGRPSYMTDPNGTDSLGFGLSTGILIAGYETMVRNGIPKLIEDLNSDTFKIRRDAIDDLKRYGNNPLKRLLIRKSLEDHLKTNPCLEVTRNIEEVLSHYRDLYSQELRKSYDIDNLIKALKDPWLVNPQLFGGVLNLLRKDPAADELVQLLNNEKNGEAKTILIEGLATAAIDRNIPYAQRLGAQEVLRRIGTKVPVLHPPPPPPPPPAPPAMPGPALPPANIIANLGLGRSDRGKPGANDNRSFAVGICHNVLLPRARNTYIKRCQIKV